MSSLAYQAYRIPALDGGLVTDVSPRVLDQGQGYAKTIRNMDLTSVGIPKKRAGTKQMDLPALPDQCIGLYKFVKLSSNLEYIMAAAGDSVYFYDSDLVAWRPIKSNLKGTQYDFLTYSDQLVIVNGTDPAMLWDGTTVTFPGDFPICTMLAEWRGRIVAAGIKDDPCKVMLSHAIDPTIWDPAAIGSNAVHFYVGPDDGEPITGLINTGEGGLLVTKPTQLYGIFGYTRQDMTVDMLDTVIGGAAHAATVYARPNAYFCGRDGVFRYNGNIPTRISETIQTLWDDTVAKDNLDEAVGALVKRTYVLTVPTKDGGRTTFAYHIDRERWAGVWDAPLLGEALEDNGDLIYTETGSNALHEVVPGVFTDDEKAFTPVLETHQIDMEVPERDKDVSNAYLIFMCADEPYTAYVTCAVDGSLGDTVPFVCTIRGQKGTQVVHRMHIGKTGRFFAFKMWSTEPKDFRPLGITLAAHVKGMI